MYLLLKHKRSPQHHWQTHEVKYCSCGECLASRVVRFSNLAPARASENWKGAGILHSKGAGMSGGLRTSFVVHFWLVSTGRSGCDWFGKLSQSKSCTESLELFPMIWAGPKFVHLKEDLPFANSIELRTVQDTLIRPEERPEPCMLLFVI